VSSKPLKQTLLVGKNGMSPVYTSTDLNNLLSLELPGRGSSVSSADEIKKRSLMSVFYLILLQMTGYFDTNEDSVSGKLNPSLSSIHQMKGKENDSSLSSAELDIAVLLERIISITPYYTTEVCHFEMKGGGEWTGGKVTPVIGRCINPTLALAKHSCYPTAARVCSANQTLLVAQKNMKSGEGITVNYSAPFYTATKTERQGHLTSGYELTCECDACQQDWPLFDYLPPGPQGLSDQDIDINGYKSLEYCVTKLLNGGNTLTPTEKNILETFSRVRSKLGQIQRTIQPGQPPSKVMIQNQVRLFRCLLAMYSTKMCITKTEYGTLHLPVL
jgi:hypothetical protein